MLLSCTFLCKICGRCPLCVFSIVMYTTKLKFQGTKLSQFSRFFPEPQMFSCKLPSVLAFTDLLAHQSHAFLMQTRKFFCKYSHGDLTAKVLFLKTFVLYGKCIGNRIFDMSYQLNGESSIRIVYVYWPFLSV